MTIELHVFSDCNLVTEYFLLTSGANEWKGNTQIMALVRALINCRDNFGCGNDFDPIIINSLTLLLLTHPCLDLIDS